MVIGVDASRANKQEKTGVEWYSYFVIEKLKEIIPDNNQVVLYSGDKLTNKLKRLPNNWREKILGWPPKYLWTQIRLWWELLINPPDVLLVTAHTIPFLPIRRKVKVAVTVHDVGFKRFPKLYKKIQYFYHNLTMYKIRSRADIIFTVSEFSKNEIVRLYNVNADKIKVAHIAYDRNKYKTLDKKSEALNKYKIKQPYLLFVGRIEKKKNVVNMVKAFVSISKTRPDLSLVLVGGMGNSIEEVEAIIKKNNLTGKVILPGYVDDDDLPYMFQFAEIFLFPTLYEGFGIPILQAMAVGTPVLTSDQDPHREVGGKFAIYVNPQSVDNIVSGLKQIFGNDNLRSFLINGGLERAKKFSWMNTADNIWQQIKSI